MSFISSKNVQSRIKAKFRIFLKNKKSLDNAKLFKYIFQETELFLSAIHVFLISVHEFINTACGVNKFHFPSIKWVR